MKKEHWTYRLGGLLLWGVAMLFVGCSANDDDAEQSADNLLQIVPYIADYQEMETRAGGEATPPSGYYELNEENITKDISVGLFLLSTNSEWAENPPTPKYIRYSNGLWHSREGTDFYYLVFGFMPHTENMTTSIVKENGLYKLTIGGISAVVEDDICFVTGVKGGEYIEDVFHSDPLVQGAFDYKGKAKDNYIRLLMDHLLASIQFKVKVDPTYDALRTIKLKSMKLTTPTGAITATIKLKPNKTGISPIDEIGFTSGVGSSSVTLYESKDGEDGLTLSSTTVLSEELSPCYHVPFETALGNMLTLETTYDVYDKNVTADHPKGNLIRRDCKAFNTLPTGKTGGRGEKATINLTVNPTYLYMLSEPDLDNPTMTVN